MPWDEALVSSLPQTAKVDKTSGRIINYTEALKEAMDIALAADPSVFIMGQGVDDPGGMFGITKGLPQKYGADRVFDTPLSEEGMTGIGVGAALTGMRPVYMHNRPDFLLLTFNQIVNHAAKVHFMDNGAGCVPMVIWAAIGRGWGSGAQHSQSLQGLFLGIPGLKIVMPSTPYDAKGLMLEAIADNNPVIFLEHRWLMKQKGVVPEGFYTVPLGKVSTAATEKI
jgi:pyruvate dehydrogenase E1 component beta subunit